MLTALWLDAFEESEVWQANKILWYYEEHHPDLDTMEVSLALDLVEELTFHPSVWKKEEYLQYIAKEAALSSYIVKCADRFCNVRDFSVTDPDYAVKYYHKANALWDAWDERMIRVEALYGPETAIRMIQTKRSVLNFV
jgi:hypothetical protein